jgi:hypothetical protein
VNLSTLGRFMFGSANAIREVASNRAALWIGIVLVILTGIARNYDQNFILESPFWLFGSLIFSFFSGSFIYLVLIRGFASRRFDMKPENQWLSFMGVFWMTAPIAWLYAIPVERLMNSYQAALTNLSLLGIVSVWRVLLTSRAMAVLLNIPFTRAFGWVVAAASLEIIIVIFFGAFFSGTFGLHIMAAMAGMRNAPEEQLLASALGKVWAGSWVVLFLTTFALTAFKFVGIAQPLPKRVSGKAPWLACAVMAIIWIGIAVPSQQEQHRFVIHASFVDQANYRGALAYLARHSPSDFPPARRLQPDPYEYRVWHDLPPTISLLTSNTPTWIRRVYLSHLTATLSHHHSSWDSWTNVAAMFSAIEQLPEGRQWLLTNQQDVVSRGFTYRLRIDESDTPAATARSNLLSTFRRMGMAETNLASITVE